MGSLWRLCLQNRFSSLVRGKGLYLCLNSRTCSLINFKPSCSLFHSEGTINEGLAMKFKKKDKIPEEFNIIFRAQNENYAWYAQMTALFMVTTVPPITAVFYLTGGVDIYPLRFADMDLIRNVYDSLLYLGGAIFHCCACYAFIRRYPLRVYTNNKGDYILVHMSFVPWKYYHVKARKGDFIRTTTFFMDLDDYFKYNGRRAFLPDENFHRPIDYFEMLGHPKSSEEKDQSDDC